MALVVVLLLLQILRYHLYEMTASNLSHVGAYLAGRLAVHNQEDSISINFIFNVLRCCCNISVGQIIYFSATQTFMKPRYI